MIAAKSAQTAELKAEEGKAETYRSQYPGSLHFDYNWDAKKGKELGLQQIWRDEKFTYLRGVFQETPALYELKDKKGSLINFDFAAGLYTVPKQLEDGYLTIGKQRVANLIPCTMVFVAFIVNMLCIPSMTQAIFGGSAGMAGNMGSAVGSAAKTIAIAAAA